MLSYWKRSADFKQSCVAFSYLHAHKLYLHFSIVFLYVKSLYPLLTGAPKYRTQGHSNSINVNKHAHFMKKMFPPWTMAFNMPESDTNNYMYFRLHFFLIKTDRIYLSWKLCDFSEVLGYLAPEATLHTSQLSAQLPSSFVLQ